MKLPVLAAALALAATVLQAAPPWPSDFAKAKETAKQLNRPILLDFTGSDWCTWCWKFKSEVLDTKEFVEYAKDHLVLVEVDFPQRKPLPTLQREANRDLKDSYKVGGYPTFVLVDPSGKELGRQRGYAAGGPSVFIGKLNEWKRSMKDAPAKPAADAKPKAEPKVTKPEAR